MLHLHFIVQGTLFSQTPESRQCVVRGDQHVDADICGYLLFAWVDTSLLVSACPMLCHFVRFTCTAYCRFLLHAFLTRH
jgi:hypothetical protein